MVEDIEKHPTAGREQVREQPPKATVVASTEQDVSHRHLHELLTNHSAIVFANADRCGRL